MAADNPLYGWFFFKKKLISKGIYFMPLFYAMTVVQKVS